MEDLLENQNQLRQGIDQVLRNFKKDGPERKTPTYIKKRLEILDKYWEEFQLNHIQLSKSEERSHSYFTENFYQKPRQLYTEARACIQQYKVTKIEHQIVEAQTTPQLQQASGAEMSQAHGTGSTDQDSADNQQQSTSDSRAKSPTLYTSQGNSSKLKEMLRKQKSNFKAFSRTIAIIDLDEISEKWEFEDILQTVQSRWSAIDMLHWVIDSELFEDNVAYEESFSKYEQLYLNIKKSINSKMWSVSHREKSTPTMDIPTFNGNYHQWIAFKDLFTESIHNNRSISYAQKMQFLKAKVRGEPERLIQHLHISTENYKVCWDILNHRYNNTNLLFSSHLNILLSLPNMQQQSASQIKKMYDTTNECLNAVKNLGVDVNSWDPFIVHVLALKLDQQTHSEYTDSRKNPRDLPVLSEFMGFLENKFTSLEASRRKQDGQKTTSDHKSQHEHNSKKHFQKFIKSFTNNSATKKLWKCPVCNENHHVFNCKTFLESTSDSKRKIINKLNLCRNCLYDHKGKACFSNKRCRECQGDHNTLLHESFSGSGNSKSDASTSTFKERKSVTHVSNPEISETLLPTAQIKVMGVNGVYYPMRALIDQGSQISLITENAAQLLGLPRKACKGTVMGVGAKESNCKGVIHIEASAVYTDYTFSTEVLIMKTLLYNLPNRSFQKPSWACLEHVNLADPEYNLSRPVDILLGADVFSSIIMNGLIKEGDSQVVAQQTRLGWIISGNVKSYQCSVVLNDIEDIQRFWEIEDVVDDSQNKLSEEDYECVQRYKADTSRREDGRYVVRLPLKANIEKKLGESRHKAIGQFYQLEKKLSNNDNIQSSYRSFIHEYIKLGHMQESTFDKNQLSCYLPHHCVMKSDSTTTALRVVFNASAKTSSGLSLNDLMYSGPNLQKDLFSLILKWRQYEFAYTADLEKMFRQIFCHKDDLKYQKIIWRDSPNQVLREYELLTVTYGTKAAPFLAIMTLRQLANDERYKYPAAAKVLEEDFYMDDLLSGHHTLQEAKQLQKDLIDLLKSGGFNLRKWSSNKTELLDGVSTTDEVFDFRHQESTKTLGLRWHPTEDQFTFQSKINVLSSKTVTKRSLLSDISKIFDPLGWLSPITTKLKLLFQAVWQQQLNWDDQVPEEMVKQWSLMTEDLQHINEFKLPRWLQCHRKGTIKLHGFCDASSKAFACVIYCIYENEDTNQISKVSLVTGKARLVPTNKDITLPRLELSAAVLLSKLMYTVTQCLVGHDIEIFAWSDSTAVLGWLKGDPSRWKRFVANRVKQVTDIIPSNSWRYVKSAENPADCASRGMSVEQLKQHTIWWHGPSWLPSFDKNQSEETPVYDTCEEIRAITTSQVTATKTQPNDVINTILSKYSSFARMTRILAWILRISARSQPKQSFLTITELRRAKYILIKYVQQYEFAEEIKSLQNQQSVDTKSKLLNLNPYLDEHGLLRVGGRINNARISKNMQHPIIIPHSGILTDRLIDQGHQMTFHGGARITLAWLRQEFWIIGGNRAVKKRIHNCVTCRRHNPVKNTQIMGDLPESRCNPSRPFHHTGVDFTGFVGIKANKGRGIKTTKGYIAVFVCMATKAVHLELVSDLTSAGFLAALRRMAARRGAPSHIYSDNGTNFVGANKALREEYINLQTTLDDEFYRAITDMQIQWHFNAPSWPSAGGLWEAAVKSLKYHIKRVVCEQKLTYEEYSTLLAQLEACLNTRPLCAISEDPEDIDYLTPSHFLSSGPTLTIIETERDARTRWHFTQKIFGDIWKRWKTEYLCQLSARSKWRQQRSNLKVDDIVIIQDANLPPGKWALGRIIELHPGMDGNVRVVSIKTKNGVIKRPITKLCLLPVHKDQQPEVNVEQTDLPSVSNKNEITKNRSRRRRGKIGNFIYIALMFFMLIITPSSCDYKTAPLNSNQSIYFDKISNMRLERDEWKLIVYYDMEPYWQGRDLLKKYIDHLGNLCANTTKISQCDAILMQLRHGSNELDHYNSMLLGQQFTENVRYKRGLINPIGSIARSLFGVLDDDFAQQYTRDIHQIRRNQKRLESLWKNNTSIVESENNIIKRVENAMDRHHKVFNQHLTALEKGFNSIQVGVQESLMINSFSVSSIIANSVLMNLKTIQETVVDTIMNLHHTGFNFHLITVKQLTNELNIVIGQLAKELTLPIDNIQSDLYKLYHLLKTKARVMKQFIIFEVKIPLVSRDSYDIYRIITIPQQVGNNMISIMPIANLLAINIQKDSYIPMTENDVQTCMFYDLETYICPLKGPIHQMRSDETLCMKDQLSSRCSTASTICTNRWIQLNKLNTYLYFCCGPCSIRIICEYQVTAEQLTKAGVITLGDGCVIKGDTYTVYSHKKLTNVLNTTADVLKIEIPPINNIINLSIPIEAIDEQSDHTHIVTQDQVRKVNVMLSHMKDESSIDNDLEDGFSYHDVHHYTVIYLLVFALCVAGAVHVWRRLRRVRSVALPARSPHQQLQSANVISVPCISVNEQCGPTEIELNTINTSSGVISARKQNKATSPMFRESIFSESE
ncbi:hypothetical protein PYW08_006345 [Mythimna loreyi]|uniref:Uncharacterized protein n=1 Tax=Mythimna loreyi TaxID=667449 RepID=A0ACC2QMF0_9NEOP|nr:hypothetical protein PYW08_006345 [Mythimna loreyi]